MSRRLAPVAALLWCAALALLPGSARAVPVTRNLTLLAQKNDYPPPANSVNYSACWSYVHSNGNEYAVIGVNGSLSTQGGTAIYNVVNPAAPYLVGLIPGPPSIWREFKSYRDWVYAVSEGTGTGFGLQIIRMTNPEAPVLAATYTTNFISSHTVAVDTARAILICNGTRNGSGIATGVRILALDNPGIGATPETPVEIAWWPGTGLPVSGAEYVHDSVPIGNRLYASSINVGVQRVLDFTNPAAPTQLSAWTYPGGFTHNAWPDATGNWLYVTDEIKGEPLKVFDISNPGAPVMVNGITSNPQAIVHNAHVKGSELFLSNYTEGIRVLDLGDPAHPAEFAYADSYDGPSGGYSGVWGTCPFFPSGIVIASDRNTGLYVYSPQHDYGILRVTVVDAATQLPMSDVGVHLTTQGDSLETPADGVVRFAPSPGSHTVLAHRFGWTEASATRTVTVGSNDQVTLELSELPVVNFAGTVRTTGGGAPLDGAEVSLAYTPIHEHTGPDGHFAVDVPDDDYRLEVRRSGFVPLEVDRHIGPGFPGQDFFLTPAQVWLDLESAAGWVVGAAGDNANGGLWTNVIPLGTGPRPPSEGPREAPTGATGPARGRTMSPLDAEHEELPTAFPNMAPYVDHTPGAGVRCFVTGQGADSFNTEEADLDGGKTSLTTPVLDATGLQDPVVGFWRWFASFYPTGLSNGSNGPEPNDWLAVLISNDNGANWTVVDTTRGLENHWEERSIHVADYVTPTAQVRLRFVANDGLPISTVEAAIDDLTLYDAVLPVIGTPPGARPGRLAFRDPWPNPASATVRFVLDVPVAADVHVELLDLQGRRVRDLHRGEAAAGPLALSWDGRDAAGREAPAGLYFARATMGDQHALARFLRVR